MYLQAFQHFGGLITKFAAQYNSTVWRPRPTFQEWLKERVRTNCRHFLDRSKYPKQNILFAIRISASIVMGIWVSAYSMNYSSKTPFVVGLAAQLHLGGTFNRTIWRTMGVVIGCAIPAVLQYYICTTIPEEGIALATRVTLGIFFNSLVLMSVVTCTKYIFFSGFSLLTGKIGSYSCVTVMVHSDGYGGLSCPSTLPANAQAIMYGSFTETLVGLAIVLVMEIAFQPQSARGMLERSVSNLLRSVAAAFDDLFQHHLSGDRSVDEGGVYFALSERRLEKLRVEVTKTLPALVDKIKLLLKDAELEPSLWKPAFSRVKYQEVTRICEDLLWRVRLLVDLVDWTTPTVTPVISTSASTTESPALSPTADFRGATLELSSFHLMWVQAQDQFKRYAFGTMDTLCALFGGEIAHAVDAEKCAVYMQLKEAFRRADVTRRTKINVDELANLLSSLVPQRVILGTFGETSQTAPSATPETRTLAQQLMELGDRDHDGFLDCREFVDVLDRYSCRLEFQPRPGSWAAAVAATAEADDAAPHSPQQAIPLMDEDLLYVESFTIDEAAVEFRRAYSELVYVYVSRLSDPHQLRKSRSTASGTTNNPQNLTTKQVQRIMHMSSLICATDCIAQSLARLNTVAVSSL
ncbi:TPA: hypothetical protein N0F65_003332 [Lagenidium giganteum]|uniref:EF-hand domain-containing protein n=1 Tax=Lagenidium giganteum TaxID=4803 RepID=A0AAV2ZB30_9STRA|nr:TPA: hypothetical protein N0F65_003332 [Lagenidium giganteum]